MDPHLIISFLSMITLREILAFAAVFLTLRWLFFQLGVGNVSSKYRHLPLPPSPPGLPLFGNMFSLRTDMRPTLEKWTRELGGIFNLRIGPNSNIIVINDLEVMQEAFVKKSDQFSGRPIIPLVEIPFGSRDSIIWGTHPQWKKTRRLSNEVMRNCFGLGKGRGAENRVIAECEVLVDYLRKQSGSSFNPECALSNIVANSTCSILFGCRYEHGDPEFRDFIYNLHAMVGNLAITSLGNAIPMLYYTPLYKNYRVPSMNLIDFTKAHVNEHRRDSGSATEIRDAVDFVHAVTARRRERGLPANIKKDGEWRLIIDLIVAGITTTSDTLFWALLLMAKYPEILKKCQKEIDDVIGSGKNPTMSDQDKMPFVTATIQEIIRYRPAVPLGVPRDNEEETELCGYRIPKHSVIIMDIWNLHMNPKYWDEPEKFNPSRFLSKDGKTVLNHPALNTFGMGLRVCLGERLGRMTTFLVLTNILQKFTFRLAEDSKSVDMDGIFSMTLPPNDYNIVMEERNK